jgi:flagellar basal-body rod protein FlgB
LSFFEKNHYIETSFDKNWDEGPAKMGLISTKIAGICYFCSEYITRGKIRKSWKITTRKGAGNLLDKLFTGGNIGIMEKSLAAASVRQRVIANNIANANTPGFKKSDVIFEDLLRQAMSDGPGLRQVRTHEYHLSKTPQSATEIQPQIVTSNATAIRNDGNNVDIEAEMADVAKNNLYYNTLAQMLSKRLNELKTVISQGGR